MSSSVPMVKLTSVMVDNQDSALQFFTEVLGFVKKIDVPTGEPWGARWLTVVSRLTRLGVVFQGTPTKMGPVIITMFEDTCGNLIQLIQQ